MYKRHDIFEPILPESRPIDRLQFVDPIGPPVDSLRMGYLEPSPLVSHGRALEMRTSPTMIHRDMCGNIMQIGQILPLGF